MAKTELQPPIGVLVQDFTDEVWAGVATAYFHSTLQVPEDEEVSPRRWNYIDADSVKHDYGEYRFGSIITRHSKLIVCDRTLHPPIYHFDFEANADQHELTMAASQGITPESIQNDFRTRVGLFLADLGIAQQVSCCK